MADSPQCRFSMKNTAVVTGGSKGIGFAIVENLLSNGWNVVSGSRTSNDLPKSANQDNYLHVKGDVRNSEFHEKLAQSAIDKFETLNSYVNNAGYSEWRSLEEIDGLFLNHIFETNLFSYFYGSRAASKYIKVGSLINISSIAGKRGSINNSAYVATKFGVEGLTQSLAKELGPKGIRVNAICPVLIETPGLRTALSAQASPNQGKNTEKFLNEFAQNQSALNRLPTLQEVSDLCLYLMSDKSSGITGQSINVDCGVLPG